MKTSNRGVSLIKEFESYRSEAYVCPAGVWTVGYGTTRGVKKGVRITMELANILLKADLAEFEANINRMVKVELSQAEFDSLVSLCYNIGIGAFNNSTCLKRLNRGDYDGAFEALKWWNKITQRGKKVISQGLVNRRNKEAKNAGY